MTNAEQKKIKLSSLAKEERESYVKPVLRHFGSIVSLTSGTGGSGADICNTSGGPEDCPT